MTHDEYDRRRDAQARVRSAVLSHPALVIDLLSVGMARAMLGRPGSSLAEPLVALAEDIGLPVGDSAEVAQFWRDASGGGC